MGGMQLFPALIAESTHPCTAYAVRHRLANRRTLGKEYRFTNCSCQQAQVRNAARLIGILALHVGNTTDNLGAVYLY